MFIDGSKLTVKLAKTKIYGKKHKDYMPLFFTNHIINPLRYIHTIYLTNFPKSIETATIHQRQRK